MVPQAVQPAAESRKRATIEGLDSHLCRRLDSLRHDF
jgi:hypothetical protein